MAISIGLGLFISYCEEIIKEKPWILYALSIFSVVIIEVSSTENKKFMPNAFLFQVIDIINITYVTIEEVENVRR